MRPPGFRQNSRLAGFSNLAEGHLQAKHQPVNRTRPLRFNRASCIQTARLSCLILWPHMLAAPRVPAVFLSHIPWTHILARRRVPAVFLRHIHAPHIPTVPAHIFLSQFSFLQA